MRLIPGDPALAILSADDAAYTEQELQELRVELGTDRPIVVQYFDWMSGLLRETSARHSGERAGNGPVGRADPVTIELAILGIGLR